MLELYELEQLSHVEFKYPLAVSNLNIGLIGMDFSIRQATERDYEELSKIYAEGDALHSKALPQVFREAEGPARTRESITSLISDENAALFVAEYKGQIVGLVHVYIRESPTVPIMVQRRYAYVGDLAVTTEFRRHGVGQALMNEAQRWAMQKKVSQLELTVWDFNEEAITFFKGLGYTMARHQMWKSIS